MRHTVTFVILALTAALAETPVFAAADTVGKPAEVITTDRVDFAPGGTIRIDGSYGVLNIEGWDKPEVEITFTKSRPLRFGESPSPDRDKSRLESIQLKTERKSATELAITTTLKPRRHSWTPPFGATTTNDVLADYDIHVPRDSKLLIKHGSGLVQVRWVTGDIQASARRGDLLLWLPQGPYSIDAVTKFGIVSSELDGTAHDHYLTGERYVRDSPAPAHRVNLHIGYGGITIRQIPPEE
jgi:hypothetical protein